LTTSHTLHIILALFGKRFLSSEIQLKGQSAMTKLRYSASLMTFAIFILAFSLFPIYGFGQATTGSISARVVDPLGNVVLGARVSIRDVDKGIVTTETTNGIGEITATALPPAHYTITVESAGFATATVPAFELNIDQKARFNILLKVGSVSSNIVVSESVPVLQLQGAETGQVMNSREITDLPLEGRQFTDLMLLTPGVGQGGGGNTLNLSVDGQREFSNSVQINGVEVTGNRNNDTNVFPSPDALQEFKMVTSAYAPEFGRASGGSVLIQTKAGTNNLHGSAYYFYRPTATAANYPLAQAGASPTLKQKIYGATIGGPIKKDKAFIFLSYEGNRKQDSSNYWGMTPPVNQVSFNAAGDADLSALTDPYTGNQIPIFDPVFFNNNYYSEQFSGNIIPAYRISPAGKLILQNLFPKPQNNSFYTNFSVNQAYIVNGNVANLRTDYTFSQNNRIYLTYDAEQGDTATADPYAGKIPITNGGSGDSADLTSYENHVISLKYDHVFSATLLNELGGSYFLSTVSQNSPLHNTDLATKWNIQNVVIQDFPSTENFPQIQFQSGPTVGGSTYKPLNFRDKNISFVDALTWTHSRHNAKFGYEYRHLNSHPNFSLFPTPYEYIGGAGDALTSDPTYSFYDSSAYYYNGGSEIADLLLGLPYVVDQGLQLTTASTTANEHTVYAQDYWQVTSKLNITFGVRYEYQQPYVESNNKEANFDTKTLLINLAGRGSNSSSLVNSNTTDFMPRVGFSYQFRPSWVIRGGFGVFYSPENDAREDILTKTIRSLRSRNLLTTLTPAPTALICLTTSMRASPALTIDCDSQRRLHNRHGQRTGREHSQTVYSEPTTLSHRIIQGTTTSVWRSN
jgi:outer membrane receptor protein involved in Fe transport